MTRPKKLLLFDVDGTLVGTRTGIGRRALEEAVRRVIGKEVTIPLVMCAGRMDPQIVESALLLAETAPSDALYERILGEYVSILRRTYAPGDDAFLHRGVRSLVVELAERGDVLLAVLTGNVREGARIKLEAFDIWRYFPVGAFGDDSRRRNDLPPVAIQRARVFAGCDFDPRRVFVVGDTVHDVEAGVSNGLRTIALATHREFLPELRAAGPDFLLDGLYQRDEFMAAIEGDGERFDAAGQGMNRDE